MFFLTTKTEMRQELERIKEAFKERDETIKELRQQIQNNSLKIATIEGILLSKSQSQNIVLSKSKTSLDQSQTERDSFETNVIRKIKKNKRALVVAEIMKLWGSMPLVEIFHIIVSEKKMTSKASFYRYVDSLKSHGDLKAETEPKTEIKAVKTETED